MKQETQVQPDEPVLENPESALEKMLIDQYLQQQGIKSVKDLCKLPEDQAKQTTINVCRFVSLKLAQVESTNRLLGEIHFVE